MEKAEILKCHENFIQRTYMSLKEYELNNISIDEKIKLLYEKLAQDNNLSEFYSEYAVLVQDKTLNLIEIEEERAELLISRARIFHELGLMSQEEKIKTCREALEYVIRYYDVEYKLMLIKLVSIADMDSKEYADLVDYLYRLRSEGAVLRQNVLKKDI